jgi:hypothetical protein
MLLSDLERMLAPAVHVKSVNVQKRIHNVTIKAKPTEETVARR